MTWSLQDEQRVTQLECDIANLREKRARHFAAERLAIGAALGLPMADDVVGIVIRYQASLRTTLNSIHDAQLVAGGKIGAGDMLTSVARPDTEANREIALAVIGWSLPPDLAKLRVALARCIIDHKGHILEILE